ncbi:hypothetical protein KCU90_g2276, partial [Aureobasidium melanogenum]
MGRDRRRRAADPRVARRIPACGTTWTRCTARACRAAQAAADDGRADAATGALATGEAGAAARAAAAQTAGAAATPADASRAEAFARATRATGGSRAGTGPGRHSRRACSGAICARAGGTTRGAGRNRADRQRRVSAQPGTRLSADRAGPGMGRTCAAARACAGERQT